MRLARRHRMTVATIVVVVLFATGLIAFVIATRGNPARVARLNDGTVWVSTNSTTDAGGVPAQFGQMNADANQFSRVLQPASGNALDVLQLGSAILGYNGETQSLTPIDPVKQQLDAGDAVRIGPAVVLLGGNTSAGTLVVLDAGAGKLWAMPVSATESLGSLSPVDPASAKPVAAVGSSAAAVVDEHGVIHVVSPTTGLLTVTASPKGWQKHRVTLSGQLNGALTVTAVGDKPIVMARGQGSDSPSVRLPSGRVVQLTHVGYGAVLQQPGPQTGDVLVETSTQVLAVGLDSGAVRTVSTATGTPVAPIYFEHCIFAAWGGSAPSVVRACGNTVGRPIGLPTSGGGASDLVFRVNHQHALLQDRDSGQVWNDESGTPVQIADWSAVQTPKTSVVDRPTQAGQADATKAAAAKDDTLGARPGRVTTLHVLDNDRTPAGTVLSVNEVTAPTASGATVSVAPDAQSVLLSLPDSAAGSLKFQYDDANGGGKISNKATVTVNVVPDGTYFPPNRRGGGSLPSVTSPVAVNGTVTIPVLNDWRVDADGDPPALAPLGLDSTHAPGASAITTPDGSIVYHAGKDAGADTIKYVVEDGGKIRAASIPVAVIGHTGHSAPPTAANDFVRVAVGQPVTFAPLANDLPGVDPLDPSAQLHLAGSIKPPAGLQVSTPDANDQIVITATARGQYKLTYQDNFGATTSKSGVIRVEADAADTHAAVEAGPDSVTLRGTVPALLDPLVNDLSPTGGLLTVVGVDRDPSRALAVAVVHGRWLRVNLTQPVSSPTTDTFTYRVTDGRTTAVGSVTVVETPTLDTDVPLAQTDYAVVRAGDAVTVPVLDNDIDPAGDTLALAAVQPDAPAPGTLEVIPSVASQVAGSAFVSGNVVRYVAPPVQRAVTTQQQVTVRYATTNNAGEVATGQAVITIVPGGTAETDHAPTPQEIDARVVAGATITIPVPTSGVDSDGDTVQVQGLAVPQQGDPQPHLGAVTGLTSNSLTYQAFPAGDNQGTDVFTYEVADTYGVTARATVRVAVVQPTVLPDPVAHLFTVVARPGSTLDVDVVTPTHVDYPDGAAPELLDPISSQGDGAPIGTLIAARPGWLRMHVPSSAPGNVATQLYTVRPDLGRSSTGTIRIQLVPGYNPAPLVTDQFATPKAKATSVVVNLLKGAASPSGSSLSVKSPAADSHGAITVRLLDHPQAIPFVINDDAGAMATAVAYIPATGAEALPRWNGKPIQIREATPTTVALKDYVVDPQGLVLELTTKSQIWRSPVSGLDAVVTGKTEFQLTGQPHYQGPGSVTFAVTRTGNINQFTLITIPVIVGDPDPVLRCPTDTVLVTAGLVAGQAIAPLNQCHVWTAPSVDRSALTFHAVWHGTNLVRVSTNDSARIVVLADHNAKPKTSGTLTLTVDGHPGAKPATMNVSTTAADPITVAPIVRQNVLTTGAPTVIELRAAVVSPFGFQNVAIVRVGPIADVAVTHSTGTITIKATKRDLTGTRQLSYIVTDIADRTDTSRWHSGTITLQFVGVPGAPTGLAPVTSWGQDQQLLLHWVPPADNGAPIDRYEVSSTAGTQSCAPGDSCVITHLTNSQPYQFRIRAHNAAGWGSVSSQSAVGVPDVKPGAITGFVARNPQDKTLTLYWNPLNDHSSAKDFQYVITWTGGVSGQKVITDRSTGSYPIPTVPGLDNDAREDFQIYAHNEAGDGPVSPLRSQQSAGSPSAPAFAGDGAFKPEPSSGGSYVVTLTWQAVDPNGPQPLTYTVTRDGGTPVCKVTAPTVSCSDQGFTSNGTSHVYHVVAANAVRAGGAGNSRSVEWTQPPDQITSLSLLPVQASDPDGQVSVRYTTVNSHGSSLTVHCTYSTNGAPPTDSSATCPGSPWSASNPSGGESFTQVLSNLNPGSASVPVQVVLWEDNGAQQNGDYKNGAVSAPSNAVDTNAPPPAPTKLDCGLDGDNVVYNWSSVSGTNGRTITYQLTGDSTASTRSTSVSVPHTEDYLSHSITVTAYDGTDHSSPPLSVTCADKAPPPPPPIDNLNCNDGTTITWTWSNPAPPNANVQYHLILSGAVSNGNYSGTSAQINPGQSGQSYTLTVVVADNDPNGAQQSAQRARSCSAPQPPPPPNQFHVRHGGPCSYAKPNCELVYVSLVNFTPNGSASCYAGGVNAPNWGPYTLTAGANGTSGEINKGLFDTSTDRFADGDFYLNQDAGGLTCH